MSKMLEAALGDDMSERFKTFLKQLQKDNSKSARRDEAVETRLADIEFDLGFLAMLQVAMLRLLSDKGILEGDELVTRLAMADRLDGIEDGRLAVSAFRNVIGLPRKARDAVAAADAAAEEDAATIHAMAKKAAARSGRGKTAPAKAPAKAKAKAAKKGKK